MEPRQAARRAAARILAPTGLLTPLPGHTVTPLDLLRRRAAGAATRAADRLHDHHEHVGLEHLPARRSQPRWGHGRPLHAGLRDLVAADRIRYEQVVDDMLGLQDDLLRIGIHADCEAYPCWHNDWLPGVDTAALYTFLRTRRPRRYIEVGSGFSTRVAARAVRDGGLDTTVMSIDPAPRAVIDQLCDVVVRRPLEDVPADLWSQLEPGDMVFVDNSHRTLMHSDATVFFLEVLPSLPDGVLVGIHDILLPADYFASWGDYLFSEQYLLAAYLLGVTPWLRPAFAAYWASCLSDTTAPLAVLWDALDDPHVDRRGWSYWLDIVRPPAAR